MGCGPPVNICVTCDILQWLLFVYILVSYLNKGQVGCPGLSVLSALRTAI